MTGSNRNPNPDLLPARSVDESTVSKDEGDHFVAFRNAARRGASHQDCHQAYATKCPKGLREFIGAEAKY